MFREKGFAYFVLLILVLVFISILIGGYYFFLPRLGKQEKGNLSAIRFTSTPVPTSYQFPYKTPKISKNNSYRIVIVGDSVVSTLGPNANVLREYLIGYYPSSEFVTYNYGYPSTNVLSLYERLTEKTKNNGVEIDPILNLEFELIIIESFGYNPLSQYPLSEGLIKQNEVLEKSIRAILSKKPNAALIFLTPIAPDPVNFSRGTLDLSPEVRKSWVEERIAYINNHKKFAEEKGIPVIDVYSLSLKPNGEVERSYISDDTIHPSKKGVDLISKSIADYVFINKIFPE